MSLETLRRLEFPDDMYEHIEEYREQQIAAAQQ